MEEAAKKIRRLVDYIATKGRSLDQSFNPSLNLKNAANRNAYAPSSFT